MILNLEFTLATAHRQSGYKKIPPSHIIACMNQICHISCSKHNPLTCFIGLVFQKKEQPRLKKKITGKVAVGLKQRVVNLPGMGSPPPSLIGIYVAEWFI